MLVSHVFVLCDRMSVFVPHLNWARTSGTWENQTDRMNVGDNGSKLRLLARVETFICKNKTKLREKKRSSTHSVLLYIVFGNLIDFPPSNGRLERAATIIMACWKM